MSTWTYCGVLNLNINDLWLHQLQVKYYYCSTILGLHIILNYLHIILNIPVIQWVCGSTIGTLKIKFWLILLIDFFIRVAHDDPAVFTNVGIL